MAKIGRCVRKTSNYFWIERNNIDITCSISLSTPIFNCLDNKSEDLRKTVIHEACHIVDFYQMGFMSHGKNWQNLMLDCDIKPNRYHNMSVDKKKRIDISCAQCNTVYPTTKVMISRRKNKYRNSSSLGRCKCGCATLLLPDATVFHLQNNNGLKFFQKTDLTTPAQ